MVPTSTNSITWEPLRNADSRAESQVSESEALGRALQVILMPIHVRTNDFGCNYMVGRK